MLCARLKLVLCLIQLLTLKVSRSVLGLESVHIQVPLAVLVGTSATLVCECDLPDEDLYSVKWYKGKHEFFRYTSKEIPSIKIFPKAGISVNVNLSNASHLVLVNLEPQSSGKYSCEITEAAPSFHTKIATRTMNVVDVPAGEPQILDMKAYYGAEEFLEIECRSGPSLPAAKLEWLVNDLPIRHPIQPPSRLEYSTTSSSSSSSSSNSSSSRKKQSTNKSSLQPQQVPTAPSATELESRENDLVQQQLDLVVVPTGNDATPTTTTMATATVTATASHSGTSGEHRKSAATGRYELSVSRLKLLLEHGHFRNGKLKVECVAVVFDLYRHATVAMADENYPQVRVLSNSDNGVHFSFMSDKDDVSSSGSARSSSVTSRTLLLQLRRMLPYGRTIAIADTGQAALLVSVAVLRTLAAF
uniref:Ig-like domain-containing protein n=1 Tax=Anopheles farauti TaxID=69004 RepID=A0A182QFB9_9DIPT